MDEVYVEAFFKDGSLRLSSFSQFSKHKDEQRLDSKEGRTHFVHRTSQNGGQTLEAFARHGENAYVLCGTMKYDKDLQDAFASDSYFRITNTTQFAAEIGRQIPGFVAGFEGACLYQERRIVEQDLGYVDVSKLTGPSERGYGTRLTEFLVERMQHLPYFLKERTYAHQVEYRLLWVVENSIGDYIDIKAPAALRYCQKVSTLTE